MGAPKWPPTRPLIEVLEAEPWRFEFDQAVRLLEMLLEPEVGLGDSPDPRREGVRLQAEMEFGFPPTTVRGIELKRNRFGKIKSAKLKVAVMALAGVLGPLPLAYSDMLMDRRANRDNAMRDFLDIFNHRLLSILNRVRGRTRIRMQWRSPLEQGTARHLLSVAGLGTEGTRNRLDVPDSVLLSHAALVGSRPASVSGLETTLSDFFGVAVRVLPFRGKWLDLDPNDRTRIGGLRVGRNNALGVTTSMGSRAYDPSGGFDLELETSDPDLFASFMPGQPANKAITAMTRVYVGQGMEFGLVIHGKFAERKPPRLRISDQLRLGWTAHMGTNEELAAEGGSAGPRLSGGGQHTTTVKIQNAG